MSVMKKKSSKNRTDKGFSLLLSIILVFCILGVIVFSVSRKLSKEMSAAAIQNLNESLDLIKCTIESILNKEAEFQKLMAREIAMREEPEDYINSYQKNQTMVKIAFIRDGETEGISSTGETFSEEGLDFSSGGMIDGQTQQRSGKELISWEKSKRQAEPSWAISPRNSRS